MSDERKNDPSTQDEDYLVPGAPTESADEERARVRREVADATGAEDAVENAEDPDLGVGLRGAGAERVRGYE
jgi:hypothetical protein